MSDQTNNRLYETTDAMVWAEDFCTRFSGRTVTNNPDKNDVDPGLMVGWFANAMAVMETATLKQHGINPYSDQMNLELRQSIAAQVLTAMDVDQYLIDAVRNATPPKDAS